MISIDTNLLARLVLNDDAEQSGRAVRILSSDEPVYIPVTVLLELAWVLSAYGCTRSEVAASLRAVLDMPQVVAQHAEILTGALRWVDQGLDVADAFHVALSERASKFITFDKSLARIAKRPAIEPPVAVG